MFFNSQLGLIKFNDNRIREYNLKHIKQTYSVDGTKYYFTNSVVNMNESLFAMDKTQEKKPNE